MNDNESVIGYYGISDEWGRFERHSTEYEINKRFLYQYIKNGDTVLDIGGGPGRYSLDLASRGCNVTLLDLTPKHVEIARAKALEMHVNICAVCGDACYADELVHGQFDAVLLMGPLYHIPDEVKRVKTVEAALSLLKPNGILFASFISSYAVVWDYLVKKPETILDPRQAKFYDLMLKDESFSGMSFTASHFIRPKDVVPFMAQFPLKKLHLLGSESILELREQELMAQQPEVLSAWLDFTEKICEREEFLSMTGHFLYIGQKV